MSDLQQEQPFGLFGLSESEDRKSEGMRRAAEARSSPLEVARQVAVELCRLNGETHADEVGRVLAERHGIKSLGPAAGSVFKGAFEFTGRRVRSARKTNHARELKVWRLKEGVE